MRYVVCCLSFLILFGIAAQPVYAATQPTDSLLLICTQTVTTQPEAVKKLATQLLVNATRQNDRWLIGKSNFFLGKAYRHLGDAPAAMPYLQKSMSSLQPYSVDLCASLKEVGVVYYMLGENDKAMDFYTRALALARQHTLTAEIIAISNNIGNLFDQQQHYDQAIAHYQESLQLNPDLVTKATLLSNIAKAHMGKGNLNTALELYHKSAAICKRQCDTSGLILALNGVAAVYWHQERDRDVLTVSKTLLQLQENAGLTTDRIETYNHIGLAYLNLNQLSQAIEYFGKALALTRQIQYLNTHYIYANLAFAYEKSGDYKQAYLYFQKHKKLQDSLVTLEKNKQLEELLTKYEADKKGQRIQLLQQQRQLQQLKLQKQQSELERQAWLYNTLILTAFLLLIPALVWVIFYRQKMHNKLLLAIHTEELNRQQILELIRQQEMKSIIANVEGRDKERERIARELHDGVAGSLAGIKLHLVKIADDYSQKPILERVIKNVDSVYQEVRTISHNLNPPKLLNTAFIDLLRNHLLQLAENGSLSLEFICYPEQQLNQLPDTLKIEVYRILQELMTNILKHAEATSVEVQLTQTDESINLMIEDQGKGFDVANAVYGVGLSNIKTRVTQLTGSLHLESVKGRGTIVSVDFPAPDREMVSESQRL